MASYLDDFIRLIEGSTGAHDRVQNPTVTEAFDLFLPPAAFAQGAAVVSSTAHGKTPRLQETRHSPRRWNFRALRHVDKRGEAPHDEILGMHEASPPPPLLVPLFPVRLNPRRVAKLRDPAHRSLWE